MAGPKYGISWVNNYAPTESAAAAGGSNALLPAHLQGAQTLLQPGEHPFPTTYAIERPELRIEPNIYLDALMHDVIAFGGQIVIRKFETPRDVLALSENVIVNCTGLGAKALFGDDELMPLKGLLVAAAAAGRGELQHQRRREHPGVAARAVHPHDAAHRIDPRAPGTHRELGHPEKYETIARDADDR